MGDSYRTCDIHKQQFPNNMIDTEEHEMIKLYLERTMTIEGKKVKTALFIGKSENEGGEGCIACITDAILERIKASGKSFMWKNVTWNQETIQKKDGSGTYQRNVPTVKTPDEIKAEILAEKEKAKVPASPPTTK